MTRSIRFAMACLLIAHSSLAEDFWLTKPYTQWTRDEVQKIVEDSPWGKKETVSVGLAATADPSLIPNRTRDTIARDTMLMDWWSALPVKQAMVRNLALGGKEFAVAAKALDHVEETYIIDLVGLPQDIAQAAQQSEAIQRSTLTAGKKDPIHPIAAKFQPDGSATDVLISFPRTNPITLQDDEVEVDIKLGAVELKESFKLKDMVFKGRLEL